MKIGMRQVSAVLAPSAFSAWLVFSCAKKELSEPESQSLLADPSRAMKQKAARKLAGAYAVGEQGTDVFVAVKIDKRHRLNMARLESLN